MLKCNCHDARKFLRLATAKTARQFTRHTCTQNTHELQFHERRAITLYPGAQQPLASVCTSHRSTTHTHNPHTQCTLHPPRRHSHKRTHNNNCSPLPLHRLSPPPLFLFLLLSSALLSRPTLQEPRAALEPRRHVAASGLAGELLLALAARRLVKARRVVDRVRERVVVHDELRPGHRQL